MEVQSQRGASVTADMFPIAKSYLKRGFFYSEDNVGYESVSCEPDLWVILDGKQSLLFHSL